MTPRDLVKWREKNNLTQLQAGVWAGSPLPHAARTWRRYELAERPIPNLVKARIGKMRGGKLGRHDKALVAGV